MPPWCIEHEVGDGASQDGDVGEADRSARRELCAARAKTPSAQCIQGKSHPHCIAEKVLHGHATLLVEAWPYEGLHFTLLYHNNRKF